MRLRQLESGRSLYLADLSRYKAQLSDREGFVAIARKKTGDLKTYFERKFAEGKNKMTVLNAVRAKLVARMFAVIRNNRIYQPVLSV